VGYKLSFKLLNAHDYGVPQVRKRIIIMGYKHELSSTFIFPKPEKYKPVLKDVIWDLRSNAVPAIGKNKTNGDKCKVQNHEYMTGGFSTIYMSRNRVRSWEEPSFTIQAGGRHAPIHPQASKMIFVEKDRFSFDDKSNLPYRRLSVRECARIQNFPDDFIFYYDSLSSAYKMVGNAVPVNLSFHLAKQVYEDIFIGRNGETREAWNLNMVSIQPRLVPD